MKIAICPGHHPLRSGAKNTKHSLNEHREAKHVVYALAEILKDEGHQVSIFTGTLSQKIAKINHGSFALALDIHFNAGGGRGCEVVHVPKSEYRHAQAANMSRIIATELHVRDRGAKEGWWQGGSHPGTKPDAFVTQTNCAAFIPEPLFIDNDSEVEAWLVTGQHGAIAEAIASGVRAVI